MQQPTSTSGQFWRCAICRRNDILSNEIQARRASESVSGFQPLGGREIGQIPRTHALARRACIHSSKSRCRHWLEGGRCDLPETNNPRTRGPRAVSSVWATAVGLARRAFTRGHEAGKNREEWGETSQIHLARSCRIATLCPSEGVRKARPTSPLQGPTLDRARVSSEAREASSPRDVATRFGNKNGQCSSVGRAADL